MGIQQQAAAKEREVENKLSASSAAADRAEAKDEAATEIANAKDNAHADVLKTKAEAARLENDTKNEARQQAANEKQKVEAEVDASLKGADSKFVVETQQALKALTEAKAAQVAAEEMARQREEEGFAAEAAAMRAHAAVEV